LLDDSMATAGPHVRRILTPERRLSAAGLCRRMHGMRLLAVATVTADGCPLVGPVDGYLVRGSWYFSSALDSVRMRHLTDRPQISAMHLPGEELSITVHGRATLFDANDPVTPELRNAMLAHYLPLQGPSFEEWLDNTNPVGARIDARKMFAFCMTDAD
jgi:hypothetical protein